MLLMRCRAFKGSSTGLYLAPQEANQNHNTAYKTLYFELESFGQVRCWAIGHFQFWDYFLASFVRISSISARGMSVLSLCALLTPDNEAKQPPRVAVSRNNNISGNYERVRENIWQMFASLSVTFWHLTGLGGPGLLSPAKPAACFPSPGSDQNWLIKEVEG